MYVVHTLLISSLDRDETHQEAFVHTVIVLAIGVGLCILGYFYLNFK